MSNENLIDKKELQWIIDILGGQKVDFPAEADAEETYRLAVKNGLNAMLNQSLSNAQIQYPEALKNRLKTGYFSILIKNTNISNVWKELKRLFNENNYPFIPLKGIFLSQYIYEDMAFRPMSDIDVLLKPEDAEDLYFKMIEIGAHTSNPHYTRNSAPTDHHLPGLTYKGIYIELHRGILDADASHNIALKQLWDTAIQVKDTTSIHPHLNLMYFCLHLFYTIKRGGIRLSWMMDLIIYSQSDDFKNTDGSFMEALKKQNCITPVLGILFATEKLFNYSFSFIDHSISNSKIESLEKRIFYFLNSEEESNTDYSYEIALERLKNTKGLSNKVAFVKDRVFKPENDSRSTAKRAGLLSIRMLGMIKQKVISFFKGI